MTEYFPKYTILANKIRMNKSFFPVSSKISSDIF